MERVLDYMQQVYYGGNMKLIFLLGLILSCFIFIDIALVCSVYAKPEIIVNEQVKSDKDAIEELGDYTALTNSIMTATKIDDLKPILLKIINASYLTTAGKDKKDKKDK